MPGRGDLAKERLGEYPWALWTLAFVMKLGKPTQTCSKQLESSRLCNRVCSDDFEHRKNMASLRETRYRLQAIAYQSSPVHSMDNSTNYELPSLPYAYDVSSH